ncbi:acyltransferase family protein [Paraburkholderia acidisoli]|uniref:Acyltransferase family protein n=1 Tax=Paraburkholderia acidisoli TaxID=2571748 RepID=A0A7Z2JF62_9BURK|nr:acyltransferase [Paraburkholderia acidisoli]QGZ60815.1 acyltransferase family protein [Paraburkholderia acidisoli]
MPLAGFPGLVLPTLIVTALLFLIAKVIDRRSSFYRQQVDEELSATRFHSIDGLRGFLAIAVMYHHAVITYFYYATGRWDVPPSRLGTLLGQGAVAMFFMVTALLFWTRALKAQGRMDLRRFFWSRITRMVPMYVVSSGALIVTALALTHFRLNYPLMQLFRDITSWLLFTLPGQPDVNGMVNTKYINTVYWSLVYEWDFYLLFPLMMFFANRRGSWILFVVSALLIAWHSVNNVEWYFLYGALTATLLFQFPQIKNVLRGVVGSLLIVVMSAAILHETPTAYDPRYAPLFFGIFLVVASGNSFFGILTSRAARVLGMISYSVYLTHNYLLYLTFRLVNHFRDVQTLPVHVFWVITGSVAVVVIGLSAVTYRFVEYPFLKMRVPGERTESASPAAMSGSAR